MVEFSAVLQSFEVLKNIVLTSDSMRNYNQAAAAVSEVYAKLLAAYSAISEAQQREAAFAQRIREMEAEIRELKDWDRQTERYQLTEVAPSVFAYRLKPGMEQGEPPHLLCTHCYDNKEKSILQADPPDTPVSVYRCPRCQNRFQTRRQSASVKVVRG